MKVEIKERKLTAGNRSLYLEYYEKGFRKRKTCTCISFPMMHPMQEKSTGRPTTRHVRYRHSAS